MPLTDYERDALESLCNCAKSRGRHSMHCPTFTAAPHIRKALDVAYHSLLTRVAKAERERDEALRSADERVSEMVSSGDWEGQYSMGFVSTVSQVILDG